MPSKSARTGRVVGSEFGVRSSERKTKGRSTNSRLRTPNSRPFVVTIDGPAGVGKSTVAKLLAQRLGVMYLDTGATYRSVAYRALEAGLNTATDRRRLLGLARRLPLRLAPRPDGGLLVTLKGIDVTTRIRTEEVSEAAAQVSQYPEIRSAMVALQRRLARRPWTDPRNGAPRQGVVVEGRDTGSVVFPAAPFKFFLDADPAVRARRRQEELKRLYGSRPPLAQIREQIHFRDGLDRHRKVGPLVKPEGAVPIDTTHRSAQQVVRLMLTHIWHSGSAIHRNGGAARTSGPTGRRPGGRRR